MDNLTDSGGGGEAAAAEGEEMAKHMEEVREKYAPKDTV